MSLLDDVRLALSVMSDKKDAEISIYCDTALFDMENKGVNPDFLAEDAYEKDGNTDYMPIVKTAVIQYCKAKFGRDVEASERNACNASYNSIVTSLLNGKQNIHYEDEQ